MRFTVRSIIFLFLACGRALIAAQEPIHESTDFDQRASYREYYKQPGVRPKTNHSKVVIKTCAVVGVAALTFGVVAMANLFDPHPPYKAAAAGAAAGVITFFCLSLGEK